MSEYRHRATGKIVTEAEVRAAFPLVALPAVLDNFTLDTHGYDAVLSAPAPAVDVTQVALRNGVRMDSLGNWVHDWRIESLPIDVIVANAAAAAVGAREAAKQHRADAVAAITVDVDGMTFDGDEISQGRMTRAILVMDIAGVSSTLWVLANNMPTTVTISQLQTALVKAGQVQTTVWSI